MIKKRYFVILLFVTLLPTIATGITMGIFDFANVCVFSEVTAVVTLNGKPVAGVEVSRVAEWDEKKYADKTTTDAQGHFHFDPFFVKSLMKFTPSSPVIIQTMTLTYQGKEHAGWKTMRQNYEINNELDGNKPLILSCELSEQPSKKDQVARSPVTGICKW